jgi:hypothetical protein
MRAAGLLGMTADGPLHPEGRIAGAHPVILVRERRAEEGHDPVTHHLVHRAFVAVDRFHHPLEHGVEDLPRLLRVAIGEQLHGALQVGEQHRDLLALPLEGRFGGEDPLGQVLRGVRVRGPEPVADGCR